jgi:hypothetical protein
MIGTLLFLGGMVTGWCLFGIGIKRAIELNIDGIRDQLYCELQELNAQDRRAHEIIQ